VSEPSDTSGALPIGCTEADFVKFTTEQTSLAHASDSKVIRNFDLHDHRLRSSIDSSCLDLSPSEDERNAHATF
jgi:hypothetical protein